MTHQFPDYNHIRPQVLANSKQLQNSDVPENDVDAVKDAANEEDLIIALKS